MNDRALDLLEKLASTFGTTSEYLWSVLLYQARVYAVSTLFQYLLIAGYGYLLYRLHKKFSNKMPGSEDSYYYHYEGLLGVPMVIGVVVFAILVITAFFIINYVASGLFNPEYWALDRVLDAMKPIVE
jgi:ABC-type multidrug transport system permease subunit